MSQTEYPRSSLQQDKRFQDKKQQSGQKDQLWLAESNMSCVFYLFFCENLLGRNCVITYLCVI